MAKIPKITKQNVSVIILYIFGYSIITIMEFLSIQQSMVNSEVHIVFTFDNLQYRLPCLITAYVAIALYTAATLMQCIYKFKQENKQYIKIDNQINSFANKVYRPTIFTAYCTYINLKRKTNAWRRHCNKAWEKLERFEDEKKLSSWVDYEARLKDYKLRVQEYEANHVGDIPQFPEPPNKYCMKRYRIQQKLSDEYINENIEKLRVKYNPISAGIILGGYSDSRDDINDDEYITKHKTAIVVGDRLPSILMNFAFITMFSSFTIDAFSLQMHWTVWLLFVVKLIVKLYAMANTIYSVTKYAESYNQRVTMKDILFRWAVCCEYTQWVIQSLEDKKNGQDSARNADKQPDRDPLGELRSEPNAAAELNQFMDGCFKQDSGEQQPDISAG